MLSELVYKTSSSDLPHGACIEALNSLSGDPVICHFVDTVNSLSDSHWQKGALISKGMPVKSGVKAALKLDQFSEYVQMKREDELAAAWALNELKRPTRELDYSDDLFFKAVEQVSSFMWY